MATLNIAGPRYYIARHDNMITYGDGKDACMDVEMDALRFTKGLQDTFQQGCQTRCYEERKDRSLPVIGSLITLLPGVKRNRREE